jgi:hypothetical protein
VGVLDWLLFLTGGTVGSAISGFADGFKRGSAIGDTTYVSDLAISACLLLVVSAYTTVLTLGFCCMMGAFAPVAAVSYGHVGILLMLVAMVEDIPPLQIPIRLLPAAPLWSLTDPSIVGRYALSMTWGERIASSLGWVLTSLTSILICVRMGGLPLLSTLRLNGFGRRS